MDSCDKQIAVLIPSFDPDEKLLLLTRAIREKSDIPVIIVNDGSRMECSPVFSAVSREVPHVTILEHAVNLGKGRACKSGFEHFLATYPLGTGVVTCDGDGQHGVEDILQAVRELAAYPDSLILGCRVFTKETVPWKSFSGNKLTCFFFALCSRRFVSDTQTGLRGIPRNFMRYLVNIPGERFEFETIMLLEGVSRKIPFREFPIETIYINSNDSTHFHPVLDSLKIYWTMLKYTFHSLFLFLCSGILSAIVDVTLFIIFFHFLFRNFSLPFQLALALVFSRGGSLIVNYLLNRNKVFRNRQVSKRKTFPSFLGLCCLVLGAAYLLNWAGQKLFPEWEPAVIKALVDILLFCFNYFIQKRFIFRDPAAGDGKEENTTKETASSK